jgi:hypothetical protein
MTRLMVFLACSALVLGGHCPSNAVPRDRGTQARQAKELVRGLSRADVEWHFGTLGISAYLTSDRAQKLRKIGEPAIPELIRALGDVDKYPSAHAILTEISGVEYRNIPYNGMSVTCTAANEILFRPEERFRLEQRWQRWYSSRPIPKTLPD